MKVEVTRVTMPVTAEDKPCDGAVYEQYTYVDIRGVSHADLMLDWVRESWLSEGTNYRTIDGCVCRDLIRWGWFVEMDSLEGLIKFLKDQNYSCVVHYNNSGYLSLKIYDGYME